MLNWIISITKQDLKLYENKWALVGIKIVTDKLIAYQSYIFDKYVWTWFGIK